MFAAKLKPGAEVRVVSPATSLSVIPMEQRRTAEERLGELGLRVSYSEHAKATGRFDVAPVDVRVADLHAAFADPDVAGILTTLGGYNSNQLLARLDYDLIRANPKILCGFSDITALATAIHARTGLVTYYGPHFSTFAMRRGIEYTREQFARCVMRDGPYTVAPADHWSDDAWYADQENRDFVPNPGYQIITAGEATGTLLGGHLLTLSRLFGTPFALDLDGAVLLIESDAETQPVHVDAELQGLVLQPGFAGVRGIVFGRFQRGSNLDLATLAEIVRDKPELDGIPIVADASFGHTTPQFTFPIGGSGTLRAGDGTVSLTIEAH